MELLEWFIEWRIAARDAVVVVDPVPDPEFSPPL